MAKQLQPNFEKVKTSFYQHFYVSQYNYSVNKNIIVPLLLTQIGTSFHKKAKEFNKDLNDWLNNVDIRCVGELIDVINEQAKNNHATKLPKWIAEKKFVIDYNQHMMLDLIRTDNLEL